MEEENDAAGEDEDQGEMTLSTSEVGNWDLPRILRSPAVKVHASRSRLVEGSSYFRSLLGGSFSESVSGQVCIRCNLRTAVSVLQCICGHPLISNRRISSSNYVRHCYTGSKAIERFLNAHVILRKIISASSRRCVFSFCLYSAGRGKKKSRWFSSIAQVSIDGILDLTKEWPSKLLALIKDDNSDNLKVRLTQYSEILNCSIRKNDRLTISEFNSLFHILPAVLYEYSVFTFFKIDLSGCVYFTADLLYLAVLPNDMEAVSRKRILQTLVECDQRGGNIHCFLEKLPTTLSFETVLEVDMSKCPKLHFHAVISLLHSSFPSLQVLKLSYCSHVKMEDLFSLVRNCPSLVNIDLTVDISPVIPTHASLSSASSEQYQTFSGAPYASLQHLPMVSNITKLTLEGRIDLNVLMLCYEKEFPNASLRSYQNYDHSNTTAFSLKELQMDGCKGVSFRSVGFFLPFMRLPLADDVVSFRALCHVIKRNPDLRMLRVSGCWNFYNTEGVASTSTSEGSSEDLFRELNEKCLLEEVAFGWGFTSSSLFKGKNAFARVRTMSIGLGASLDISLLPEICPLIDTLVLKFQVISDSDLRSILKSLRHLHVLDICCCLCDLTSGSFQLSMKTLKSLRLERATPWMTNDDLITLSANCLNLRELSLSGCRLLNSDAQQIISSGWPGLTVLHLEDCGSITSAGVCSLLDCVAIEDLLLCHNVNTVLIVESTIAQD
ncbi:unnamed protein product [Spirodela intermedia]|uniref:Uncharacterized protein n=1 Tax=Spirodela intermedia TaxID=51605 RepID=A0A7I8ISI0_SPIIN|nr:unnamed protein product [Spirodela intermedia]CAA6660715.1 unnamed protein product [Spirodela intermedia]